MSNPGRACWPYPRQWLQPPNQRLGLSRPCSEPPTGTGSSGGQGSSDGLSGHEGGLQTVIKGVRSCGVSWEGLFSCPELRMEVALFSHF